MSTHPPRLTATAPTTLSIAYSASAADDVDLLIFSGELWRPPSGSSANAFLFEGKERLTADGIREWDYDARRYCSMHVPFFTTPDPLAEKTPWLSPYVFCAANPVMNIDPTGIAGVRIVDEENKTLTIKAVYYVATESQYYREDEIIKELTGYTQSDIVDMNDIIPALLNGIGLTVDKREYEGYAVRFDLEFKDGGKQHKALYYANKETYQGLPIGNSIQRDSPNTKKHLNFSPDINKDGNRELVGGVTEYNKNIYMNVIDNCDKNIMMIIHEIGHTLGLSHPPHTGASSGLMAYPPQNPNKRDANNLSKTKFLPTIKL